MSSSRKLRCNSIFWASVCAVGIALGTPACAKTVTTPTTSTPATAPTTTPAAGQSDQVNAQSTSAAAAFDTAAFGLEAGDAECVGQKLQTELGKAKATSALTVAAAKISAAQRAGLVNAIDSCLPPTKVAGWLVTEFYALAGLDQSPAEGVAGCVATESNGRTGAVTVDWLARTPEKKPELVFAVFDTCMPKSDLAALIEVQLKGSNLNEGLATCIAGKLAEKFTVSEIVELNEVAPDAAQVAAKKCGAKPGAPTFGSPTDGN